MNNYYWNDWYSGWGWILWFGIVFLFFSNIGHWGYSYRTYQKYGLQPRKDALDIPSERYARGEITRQEYIQVKSEISAK